MTEEGTFPSNVLDYGGRIMGMSYERVLAVILIVCAASMLMEIEPVAALLFSAIAFPLILVSRDEVPLYSMVYMAIGYGISGKRAVVSLQFSRASSRKCIILVRGRLFSLTAISQRSLFRLGEAELASTLLLIEKMLNTMDTNAVFLSIPVRSDSINMSKFPAAGDQGSRDDYAGLLAYASRDSYYQSSYMILTGGAVHEDALERETEGARKYLESYGFSCRDLNDEEIRDCIRFLE